MERQKQGRDDGQLWRAFTDDGEFEAFVVTESGTGFTPVAWVDVLGDGSALMRAWRIASDFAAVADEEAAVDLRGEGVPRWFGGLLLEPADHWGRPVKRAASILFVEDAGGGPPVMRRLPAGDGNKRGRATKPTDPQLGGGWIGRVFGAPAFAC